MERSDMKTAIPIPVLKSRAKALARKENISLSSALDRIAQAHGFAQWGLLSAHRAHSGRHDPLLSQFTPGDLVLLGARPGKGKTLLGLTLIIDAIRQDRVGAFFTLDYTPIDVISRLEQLGMSPQDVGDAFALDTSDDINAAYIVAAVSDLPKGSVVVVDYLQLLDQKRDSPDLSAQVVALRDCAKARALIIVLISQIDRNYDPVARPYPEISDVRLPNPVDLGLFTKACFIGDHGVSVA